MGSTVIVLFGNDVVEWNESLTADTIVRMGQSLGRLVRQAELKSGQLQRRS